MESPLFHLDLLTGHEPGRVWPRFDAGSSVAVRSFGALCPVERLVPVVDYCAFW